MSSFAGPHTAFFYGTLMAPKVLQRVCYGPAVRGPPTSTSLTISPALLTSYRRHRVLGADYPAIIPHTNSTVRGTLVEGLTDGDIWRLDIFEGDEYERKPVKVRVITETTSNEPSEEQLGDEVQAESYIWIAGEHQLEDKEWDFDEFMREKMVFWAGEEGETREDIREVDEAVKAQDRDPMRGRGINGSIGKAVEESQGKEKEALRSAV
jgi:Gamma-glutamyl cyclotransferase, AIG2-like